MTSFKLRLATAAALAALAFPVLAQTSLVAPAAPSDAATTQLQKRAEHRADSRADRQAKRAEWKEKRAERQAQLKTKLAITPAQESAWATYTQALQPRSDFARLDRESLQKLSTPERIDRMRAQRAQQAAAMDARGDAVKAFYAQLEPQQQQTFDRMGQRMGGDHKPMHGRHGHGHGPVQQGG